MSKLSKALGILKLSTLGLSSPAQVPMAMPSPDSTSAVPPLEIFEKPSRVAGTGELHQRPPSQLTFEFSWENDNFPSPLVPLLVPMSQRDSDNISYADDDQWTAALSSKLEWESEDAKLGLSHTGNMVTKPQKGVSYKKGTRQDFTETRLWGERTMDMPDVNSASVRVGAGLQHIGATGLYDVQLGFHELTGSGRLENALQSVYVRPPRRFVPTIHAGATVQHPLSDRLRLCGKIDANVALGPGVTELSAVVTCNARASEWIQPSLSVEQHFLNISRAAFPFLSSGAYTRIVPAVAIGRDDGLKVNVAVNAVLVGAKVMNPTYELKIRVPLVAFRAD